MNSSLKNKSQLTHLVQKPECECLTAALHKHNAWKPAMMFPMFFLAVNRVSLPSSCELWEHHLSHFDRKASWARCIMGRKKWLVRNWYLMRRFKVQCWYQQRASEETEYVQYAMLAQKINVNTNERTGCLGCTWSTLICSPESWRFSIV